MKKNIFISGMSAELGGIEKSLIEILKFLDGKGYDIDLLLWKQHGELLKYIPSNVNILKSPSPGSLTECIKSKNIGRIFRYLKLKVYTIFLKVPWKSFKKQNNHYEIAISFTQDGYSPYYIIDNVEAEKKILWYHHGNYVGNATQIKIDERYYNKYDSIVTVSESNKKMLLNTFPNIVTRIKVIPNLIDVDGIISASKADCDVFNGFSGCKLVTVGRVSNEKGQLFAIDVANELRSRGFDFRWCFVGDGPDMLECLNKVNALGLENHCIFVGAKENPYSYMNIADVYIQPSFVESEAITLKEAMVLNKSIIASNLPAIVETLGFGKYGICCNTEINEFAGLIMHVNEKDDLAKLSDTSNCKLILSRLESLFD